MPIKKYLITLTDVELDLCRRFAEAKVQQSIDNGYKHREPKTVPTDDPTNMAGHYRGRVAELAAAKYFDCEIQPYGLYDKTKSDLLNGCEVRSLQAKYSWGDMIVHKWDKPAPYVLVSLTNNKNTLVIVGWRDLVDCQDNKYWRADMPSPAYFVPQDNLHDMATLKQRFAYDV